LRIFHQAASNGSATGTLVRAGWGATGEAAIQLAGFHQASGRSNSGPILVQPANAGTSASIRNRFIATPISPSHPIS